jgi:hypothetical protein
MTRAGLPWLLWAALAFACNRAPAPETQSNQSDQSNPSMADMAVRCPPVACVAEPNEDCAGCFAKIAMCCYGGDHDWGGPLGSFDQLVLKCQDSDACVACCNECSALSCDAIRASRSCPYTGPLN